MSRNSIHDCMKFQIKRAKILQKIQIRKFFYFFNENICIYANFVVLLHAILAVEYDTTGFIGYQTAVRYHR